MGSLRVASGTRIDTSDRGQIALYRKRMASVTWQSSSSVFNATIPEVGFGHDYVRDSLARVRPVPALLSDDPDAAPIPIDDDSAPSGLDPDLCDQLVQRLQPFPNFMGQTAFKTDIYGECYVGLIEDEDTISGERCQVFSFREIMTQGDQWRVKQDPADSAGLLLPKGTPFWRIWQPDPEFHYLPYSHMIRLMTPCETLLNLARLVKAFTLSRMATTGKLLAIADEFSLETATNDFQVGTEDAGDGEGMTDSFFDDFMSAGGEAILDPESASAVMNLIVRGPMDLIKDGIQVHDISRTMEDIMIKLRQEAREEIATGMNLPREIILGVGSTNHWNADQIKEQAWLNHLEPRAYNILDATTTAYYRPALLENDVDPDIVRRCVLWYDPTWFLGEPDRAESADFGYDNFLLSAEAWRAAKNFSPDDAPDVEEIDYRIFVAQRLAVRTTVRNDPTIPGDVPPTVEPGNTPNPDPNPDNNPAPLPEPKEPAGDTGSTAKVPDTPDVTAPVAPPPAAKKKPPKPKQAAVSGIVEQAWARLEAATGQQTAEIPLAAANVPRSTSGGKPQNAKLASLGDRHVGIERDLRARLLQAADSTIGRALERAGLKVRGKLSARSAGQTGKSLLAKVNGGPVSDIAAVIGQEAVEALGLKEDELLKGALGDLEAKYHALVKRAQHAALAASAAATGREPDYNRLDQNTEDDRKAGWLILAAGLTGLAAAALYNPHPEAPQVGEFDPTALVPPGLVRAALDRAGGSQEGAPKTVRGADIPQPLSPADSVQDVSGGATGGPDMLAEFNDQMGITEDGYVWVYGDAPRKEFPPHADLDGTPFASWDDDVLANGEGFPDYDTFFPGDHSGCCCDYSVQFVQAQDTATLEPTGEPPAPQLTRTEKADALDQPRRTR